MTFRLKIRALEKNLFFGGSASAVGLYSASITYRIHGRIQSKSHEILETSRGRKKEQLANGTYTAPFYERTDIHMRHDHECFRFALLPLISQLWIYMLQLGKTGCILFSPMLVIAHFVFISESREPWQEVTIELLQEVYSIFLGIPLFCWGLGHIVVNYLPNIWLRAPKGPLWELNRRTGLVTIFDYKRYRKEGVIDNSLHLFMSSMPT